MTKTITLSDSGLPCPICKHIRTVSPEDKEFIWCTDCGALKTKYDYDASQYGIDYAVNYLEYAKSPCNIQLNLFRLGLVARWVKPDSQLLDVGCCVGEFLRFAEHHYKNCVGFEPNSVALREAQNRVSCPIHDHFPTDNLYNCVTMFDVLEHISNPYGFLDVVRNILLPQGIVIITTPNIGAVMYDDGFKQDKHLKAWKHYKPKEHLFLYGMISMRKLAHSAGFKILHIGTEESDIRPGNPNGDILTFVMQKA